MVGKSDKSTAEWWDVLLAEWWAAAKAFPTVGLKDTRLVDWLG